MRARSGNVIALGARALPLLSLLLLAPAWSAYDRPHTTELADRMVARVGDAPITLSEVDESVVRRRLVNPKARQMNLRQLYEEELQEVVDEELLCQAAEEKGVKAPEEAVGARVEKMIRGMTQRFGSKEKLESTLEENDLTLDRLKENFRKRESREMAVTLAVFLRFTVTDFEIKQYEEKLREEGKPTRAWELRQVLIRCPAKAGVDEVDSCRERAFNAALAIKKGMSFEEAARRFSEDENTRESGGEMGFIEEGTMVSDLEKAVKKLKGDEVSPPARSDVGFHVFQMTDSRDAGQLLRMERYAAERKKWIEELRRKKSIEIMSGFLESIPDEPR